MSESYNIITTSDTQTITEDENGNAVVQTIPSGTTINTILWDGVTPLTPPDGCEFQLVTTN